MTETIGAFFDRVKDLVLEMVFRQGPWFALTCWLLAYGVPSLVDQINNGYREFKTDIAQSIDKLSESIEKSTAEQRLFRMEVSGIVDGRTRQGESQR